MPEETGVYIFKILKERKCEPRILYPAKLAFQYKRHSCYQHVRTQEILFPSALPKECPREQACRQANWLEKYQHTEWW